MTDEKIKQKILIVDDSPINIAILKEILSEEYALATASNGQDALVLATSWHPDLILLDVIMPDLDGYELCKRIKASTSLRDIAVIFVTAKAESADVNYGMSLGALDYFAKPFRPVIIKARIHGHMARIKAQQNLATEMVRDLKAIQSRLAISALLETSLEPLPLEKQLTVALDIILTIPWLAVEYQGSIHIYNAQTNRLDLIAYRNLAPQLLIDCKALKIGQCLCGLAAKNREIVFRNDLDADHTVVFEGMHPHGHYCTPILYQNTLVGVLNLYVASNHIRSPEEDALLATLANTLAGIIRHRRTEKALQEERQFISAILETTSALVAVLDPTGALIRFNTACEQLTGFSSERACGKPFWDKTWTPEEDIDMVKSNILEVAKEQTTLTFESRWIAKNKEFRYVSWSMTSLLHGQGELKKFIATGIDVTERRLAEQSLERIAHHDALTGLPNRRLFTVFLQQALARSRRHSSRLAVMFMDLDRFKSINDTYGHDIGDMLLVEAAHRIRNCLRENDVVARLGGDEFTIILSDDPLQPVTIGLVAQKIIDGLCEPFYLQEYTCNIGSSIGISRFPNDGDQPDELLKKADQALYAVKKGGRNHFLFYNPNMDSEDGKA